MDNHLTRFDDRFELEPSADSAPIFLLSAGWRCGSTLLQRLLCSTGEALVWGEPYGRSGLIPSLTRASLALRPEWPTEMHFAEPSHDDLVGGWIANMYPPPQALRDSFRAQLDTLFALPAQARGFARWGLKEVRLQAMDARFLSWVYPQARFVFLVRNPWDAWASAKGLQLYEQWPNRPIETVEQFSKHWAKLTRSFLQWPSENGLLVRYEDLIQPGYDLGQISTHCGLKALDPGPLSVKIRGIRKEPSILDAHEIALIASTSAQLGEILGYSGPEAERSATA
ncbi:MAG: hypothetical protein ACI9VR_005237 [Cognaticolwellia sp.]|jgi:hypothetical protein